MQQIKKDSGLCTSGDIPGIGRDCESRFRARRCGACRVEEVFMTVSAEAHGRERPTGRQREAGLLRQRALNSGTWYGVTVVNGDIAQIVLANNKLSGKLPSNTGDLKALKVRDLNSNAALNGGIPTSLGTIPALEQILLYQCALSGTIPITIVNATGLTALNLTSNKLTGSIPTNIGNLTKLTQLWLSNNLLGDNLPASLGNLVNLTSLQLNTNGFTGNIPVTLGNLKKLTTLRLDDNLLEDPSPRCWATLPR